MPVKNKRRWWWWMTMKTLFRISHPVCLLAKEVDFPEGAIIDFIEQYKFISDHKLKMWRRPSTSSTSLQSFPTSLPFFSRASRFPSLSFDEAFWQNDFLRTLLWLDVLAKFFDWSGWCAYSGCLRWHMCGKMGIWRILSILWNKKLFSSSTFQLVRHFAGLQSLLSTLAQVYWS